MLRQPAPNPAPIPTAPPKRFHSLPSTQGNGYVESSLEALRTATPRILNIPHSSQVFATDVPISQSRIANQSLASARATSTPALDRPSFMQSARLPRTTVTRHSSISTSRTESTPHTRAYLDYIASYPQRTSQQDLRTMSTQSYNVSRVYTHTGTPPNQRRAKQFQFENNGSLNPTTYGLG